jgi:RNA polymerase sigma-70 factor (ECF subfamily)
LGNTLDWKRLLAEQIAQNGRLFFSLARDVLRNNEAAEDVCQHALLKAWEHRDRLENAEKLKSWLATVVVNESLRMCRRVRLDAKYVAGVIQANQQPEARDHSLDIKESVASALEQLAEPQRMIVVLRLMEGISGKEVASLMDCSQATVSRLLFQAMERLRELLVDWQAPVGS